MGATWEVQDRSYRVNLRASADFSADSFRVKSHQEGVTLVLGKTKDSEGALSVQSVDINREVFATQEAAAEWWEKSAGDVDRRYGVEDGEPLDSKAIRELGGISKRVVAVHAAPDSTGAMYAGVTPPNDKQLQLINQYTRSEKQADQLAVFPVLACNDVIDRDVDQFTTDTVKGFLDLEGPLSPLGKSFLVGHNHTSLPVGRIFDGEVAKKDSVTWLKLWTYIPNTEQYKSYLENVDFGVYWAVSVGVMLNASNCSIGKSHDWGWHPYVCSEGHIKGEKYAPDGETDKYGTPVPDPNGELAWRKLEEPTDFYELSQVYLGAQYMAAFDKGIGAHAQKGIQRLAKTTVKGVSTAANLHAKNHVLMLSSDEAKKLPPLFPQGSKAAEAAANGAEFTQEDGLYTWVDDGLAWTFNPADSEELCLGRKASADSEDAVEEDAAEVEETSEVEDEEDKVETEDKESSGENKEEELSKAAVLKAAGAVKLPAAAMEALAAAPDDSNGLGELLKVTGDHIAGLEAKISELTPKAALGDAYAKELRNDALHWYTMAHRDPTAEGKGVDVKIITKLLDLAGDDVDVLKGLVEEYQAQARAKFPEAVRRSSFPENINERPELGDPDAPVSEGGSKSVKRIHG